MRNCKEAQRWHRSCTEHDGDRRQFSPHTSSGQGQSELMRPWIMPASVRRLPKASSKPWEMERTEPPGPGVPATICGRI